jgi:hypothetical protein
VWNKTKKRDASEAESAQSTATEWITAPVEHLRIVSDTDWQAAHERLAAARAIYLRGTSGGRFGRPALGSPSPYLLTNFGQCGLCGHSVARLRPESQPPTSEVLRRFRLPRSCSQRMLELGHVPTADADAILIEVLLDDVLDQTIITDAIDEARQTCR